MDVSAIAALIAAATSFAALFVALWGKRMEISANERRAEDDRKQSEIETAAELLERHAARLEEGYTKERERRIEADKQIEELNTHLSETQREVRLLGTQFAVLTKQLSLLPARIHANCPRGGIDCPADDFAKDLEELMLEQKTKRGG